MKVNFKIQHAALLNNNAAGNAKPLTREHFYDCVRSPKVKHLIDAIERLPEGSDLRPLKDHLPAAQYMAQCPSDGHRPKKGDSLPTGLCMHDFDHLTEDVEECFQTRVRPLADQLHLALAHITPSGHGLRLVTQMEQGESIEECQKRVADMVGLAEFMDEHVKDICRLSYLVCESYILYLQDHLLFDIQVPETPDVPVLAGQCATPDVPVLVGQCATPDVPVLVGQRTTLTVPAAKAQPGVSADMEDIENAVIVEDAETSEDEAEVAEEAGMPQWKSVPTFEGVSLPAIVQKLQERVASMGVVQVGQRNNNLYTMALMLRPLVQDSFQMLYELLQPLFSKSGLKDDEIRHTIASAVGQRLKHPGQISQVVAGVLSELQVNGDAQQESLYPPMPELPRFWEMLTSLFPARLRETIFFASLPMLGTYATEVRFNSGDESKHSSLTFLVHVMGPAASGKSCVNVLKRHLMGPIMEQDKAVMQEMEKERKANSQKGANERKKHSVYRLTLVAPNTTIAALYQQITDSQGKHLLLITDEIRDILKQSGSAYTSFQDILLHSFHNEEVAKNTVGDTTSTMREEVFLNVVTCGTPGVSMQFYKNCEDGLVTRTIYVTLPSSLAEKRPHYPQPNEKQQALIDETIEMLRNESGYYSLPVLEDAIEGFIEEGRKRYIMDENATMALFGHRAAEIGMRVGVLAWLLEGKPKCLTQRSKKKLSKAGQRIINLALWAARVVQLRQYYLFGQQTEEQVNAVAIRPYRTQQQSAFDELPATFTAAQLNDARLRAGLKPTTNPSVPISRWAAQGWIAKQPDGRSWAKLFQTSDDAIRASTQAA